MWKQEGRGRGEHNRSSAAIKQSKPRAALRRPSPPLKGVAAAGTNNWSGQAGGVTIPFPPHPPPATPHPHHDHFYHHYHNQSIPFPPTPTTIHFLLRSPHYPPPPTTHPHHHHYPNHSATTTSTRTTFTRTTITTITPNTTTLYSQHHAHLQPLPFPPKPYE